MFNRDPLTRVLHQEPDPSGGGQPAASNQGGHPRPAGYVPEVEAHLTKQHQIWEGEKAQFEAQVAELTKQNKGLVGYKELYDHMGAHPQYGKVLQGWMNGYDYDQTARMMGQPETPASPPGDPDDQTAPNTQAIEKLIEQKLGHQMHQFQEGLRPAVEQLHKLTADREVSDLLSRHPDAKNYIDDIQTRVRATGGKLPLEDAYRLAAFESIERQAFEKGTEKGRFEGRFQSVEPPALQTHAEPRQPTEQDKAIDAALKAGQRGDAAQLSMAKAIKEVPGAMDAMGGAASP